MISFDIYDACDLIENRRHYDLSREAETALFRAIFETSRCMLVTMNLMYSDNINFWYDAELLLKPTFPWEFVQLGNCGSPMETEAGWLVLSHGVGPMRKYCIGAFLLDRDDPTKLIGRLREPLLKPTETEREGYVPNVVYSCGSLIHQGKLVLPYAISDHATNFATVSVDELLDAMT